MNQTTEVIPEIICTQNSFPMFHFISCLYWAKLAWKENVALAQLSTNQTN